MVLIHCCQWPEFNTSFVQVTRYFLIISWALFCGGKNPQTYLDLLFNFWIETKSKEKIKTFYISIPFFFSVEEIISVYKYI